MFCPWIKQQQRKIFGEKTMVPCNENWIVDSSKYWRKISSVCEFKLLCLLKNEPLVLLFTRLGFFISQCSRNFYRLALFLQSDSVGLYFSKVGLLLRDIIGFLTTARLVIASFPVKNFRTRLICQILAEPMISFQLAESIVRRKESLWYFWLPKCSLFSRRKYDAQWSWNVARKFSNIDFFLKILPLKDDELVIS